MVELYSKFHKFSVLSKPPNVQLSWLLSGLPKLSKLTLVEARTLRFIIPGSDIPAIHIKKLTPKSSMNNKIIKNREILLSIH